MKGTIMGLRLIRRINPAIILAVFALVLAMSGGAYAASRYVITSTKQISPKVLTALKGARGKSGANGANGSTGPAGGVGTQGNPGASGTPGAPGSPGAEGKAGTSVTSKELKPGEGKCGEQGGVEFTAGSTKTAACNGATGFTEFLPKGKTETGSWSTEAPKEFGEAETEKSAFAAISFSIPLESALSEEHTFFVAPGQAGIEHAAECPGTPEAPAAAEGDLCVYATVLANLTFQIIDPPGSPGAEHGAGKSGAMVFLPLAAAEPAAGYGSWAVTAE
jgi:hypothetical protein